MPKFKEGDYVTLREDARYPTDGSLWSKLDSSLIPGHIFKVSCLGRFSWNNFEQDCVGLDVTCGWIPEICFDPVVIPKFKKGDIVECYRLPNSYDWSITACGKVEHNLKVGGQYEVVHVSARLNLELKDDNHSYPPTIFRKVVPSVEELPEKWAVACKEDQDDTPELKEWRNQDWTSRGYITYGRTWYPSSSGYTEISYETFLEKVYKPWKAQQSTVFPEKWAYRITKEDDLELLNKWRKSKARYCLSKDLISNYILFDHPDGSWYYGNSSSNSENTFLKEYKDFTLVDRNSFYSHIINPWLETQKKVETEQKTSLSVLPERWAYSLMNESADRLKLIQEWRLSVCEKPCYRNYSLHNTYVICNHEDGSYFYSGSFSCYTSYCENVVEITKEDFDRLILQPWIDKGKPDSKNTQQETTKPSELLEKKIVTTVDVNARVVRGRDWDWGNQGDSTVGTIISQSSSGWVRVQWDNGDINGYRIGDCNKYDLYYAEDQIPVFINQYPISSTHIPPTSPTSSDTTVSYQQVLSSTPHLIINKPKKRLLSTEVSELNVNLKLLKTN